MHMYSTLCPRNFMFNSEPGLKKLSGQKKTKHKNNEKHFQCDKRQSYVLMAACTKNEKVHEELSRRAYSVKQNNT